MTAPRKPVVAKWGVPWRVREGEGTIIETEAGEFVVHTLPWGWVTKTRHKRAIALAQFIVETINRQCGPSENDE